MAYAVRWRDEELTKKAGFELVAGIPFLLDSRPGYHEWGSEYLIDRGLSVWISRGHPSGFDPTTQSIENYAKWLANFLEWSELRKVSLTECTYSEHILGMYQSDMLKGHWSAKGQGLAVGTVIPRVLTACDFLKWLHKKGHRQKPFEVLTTATKVRIGSRTGNGPYTTREVHKRVGNLRRKKSMLVMPTPSKVRHWLRTVNARSGQTFGLMCESVLLAAPREAEMVGLRVDGISDSPSKWAISNPTAPKSQQEVLLELLYGVKGKEKGFDHGDKVPFEGRTIRVPRNLVLKWVDYKNNGRTDALKVLAASAATRSERDALLADAVHLFLHPDSGERISEDQLYRAWKGGDLPFPEWTVHMGRDWWACSKLLQEVQRNEVIARMGKNVSAQLLESTAISIIRLIIQPQLGHLSESTTFRYLQWVTGIYNVPMSLHWDKYLEGGLPENFR